MCLWQRNFLIFNSATGVHDLQASKIVKILWISKLDVLI